MKKSKGNQATLFQTSWGHSAQSSTSRNPNSNKNEPNTSQAHMGAFSVFDPNEMVEFEDDEDDDELLAAAEGIVPFDEAKFRAKYNGGGQAKATNISCNPDDAEVIPGFDLEAGNVWIYPTNYPIRNYQYNIVEQALFKNTLVTLPTGLGKTFIAAVIMYNFYRWYPQGKVIFMAPTKPLVAQQIEACYNIMGIPQSDTAEMTGNMAPNKRQSMWQSRRVFFLTPQVLQNDLNRGSCKAEEVVLLVADEAHKALGNHAYCQVVREISGYTRNFRVLALSATPGDNPEAVQQVITNLLISHMELRSEESPDIKPYTHSRLMEKVVVSLGEDIAKVKNSFLKILETIVGRLFCQRVLWNSDPQRVSKSMLLTARDQCRKRMNEQGGFDRNRKGLIEGDFAMCISLYHAYELLLQHGILSFYNFIKAIIDGTKGMARTKAEITKNHEFTQLMDGLREEIEPPMESGANESLLFSQFSPRRRALMNVPKPSTTFKSHPKLLKLKEIVLEHFEKFQDKSSEEKKGVAKGVATRVMIFSQYRDSVNEIAAMLSHHKPVVRVMSFIGQQSTGKSTRGLTQKEQLQVVQRFRQGGYNTLVATCVGEEGLDIGEVDLIVCFDAHASPIRLVQRMGRTGRKRDGRIVILVTEGREEQVYMRSQRSKKSIYKAVTQAAKSFDLYTDNHRMVPRQITPAVLKMEMTVGKFVGQSKGKKEKRPSDGSNIKKFTTKSLTTASKKSSGFLTYEEVVYWQENFKLPEHEAGLSPQLSVTKKSRRSLSDAKKPVTQISLSEWLPWQTSPHAVKAVTHSRRTEHLIELLEFTELQGGRGDDDESYDLEMMSFLNEEDILKPGQKEEDAEGILVFETDPDVAREENEGTSKITRKAKKTRKKLQIEDDADAENDGLSSRKEGNGENGTTAKKKSKRLKKRSPENKARWKAFLNQLDNQEDEDFESDSANAAVVPDEDKAVDDCLQRADDETLDDDLPDIGDPWKPDDKPAGVDNNQIRLIDSNKPITTHKEITRVQECEGDDLSDSASDEMTNLLPAVTPHSQGSVPGFQLQNKRFPLVMASVPTPPSLDALDKMSLSSADAELHDFNVDFEEIQRKYFGEKQFEKDVMDKSETVSSSLSPNVCFEVDLEPFLMADFLQDEERNSYAEPSENAMLKMSRDERKGPVTSTSDCPSETATKTYYDKPISREVRYGDSENQSSKDKYGNFECVLHGNQGSRVVAKECNNDGGTKDHDTRGISNDTVADMSCSSPVKGEEATIGEGFFMDATDEVNVFANITLLGDDNVGVNETKSDKHEYTDKQDLLLESEWVRNKSVNVNESGINESETRLGTSKQVGKSNRTVAGQCRTSGDVDLRKSISKLSAFQRCSTNNQDTRSEKEKIEVLKKRNGTLSMEAKSTLPLHEVRTRGEHSNSNASHSEIDEGMLHAIRNSGAAPPPATNLSNKELSSKPGMKLNNLTGAFRDGLSCRDNESERPGRKSHLTGLTSRGRVENENGDAADNIGNNVSLNTTIKTRDKEGSIGDNTVNNIGDNADNACRTPLPKKRKLSLKRTSPKDKGMPATKKQGKSFPVNEAKSLDFGASQSLNLNRREENFCSTNVQETEVNPTSWVMKYRASETSVKQSVAMETAPRGPSLDCEDPSANSANLRTENGNVVAVMDSDDDDEDDIRPVGKASSRRRQALSSPCSQGFKMPAIPGKQSDNNQRNGLSSRHFQLGSESDDEFETDKSARNRSESVKTVEVKPRAQKRNSLDVSAKQGTRKSLDSFRKKNSKRFRNDHFLDDEAELSGSDINDFSSDETDGEDEDEMDSFIDDATQLTQRTPSATKPRPASSPVDMMAVYRQSLMSPLCGALNFRTPAFHKQRNKYKMVYKYRGVEEDSQSASEAEETYESESVLENKGEAEDENEAEIEYESEAGRRSSESAQANAFARADVSFEESQIGRPVKRMKRKRILDDSFGEEVSPRLSKQRNFSETCEKENILGNNAISAVEGNKTPMGVAQQRKSGAFGNFLMRPTAVGHPFQGDFVKSSEALANKKTLHDNTSTLRRSEVSKGSMRRSGAFIDEWNDISDSDLLVALEDKVEQASINRTSEKSSKPQSNDKFYDQDFEENPVAMDMTDNDISMKTSTLPNFSLGFDFLWEVTSMNSENEKGRNSAKDDAGTFLKQRNENCAGSVNRHSGAGFPNFTKITQHSGQNSDISCQELSVQHTENKVNVNQMSRSASESAKVEPRKVTNCNIFSGRSVVSDQNQAFNKSLTTQNKNSSHNANAQGKLQVVTPSCRTNDAGTRPAISPLLTSSQRDKGKTVILVDTREISSSQVVSLLRLKHNIKAEVCQLTSCDYIVSNRMAVKRKTASDVANGANSQKLVECMRRMCDLYDRPCLIIEKDRVKPGETQKHFIKSKAYILTLASIAQTHVKIIFSESQEETARLLTDLADIETKKGTAITACTALSKEREQVFRVVQSIPRVSYITALNLCLSFNTLQEIVNSTAAELERRTPGLSNSRAAEIHKYLRHKFNSDMLAAKK